MGDQRVPPDEEPDATPAAQPGGETPDQPPASADETTVLPPSGGDRWSARAGVRPGHPPEDLPAEAYVHQPGARWWAPALVAVITLVLLGVLGVGIWLILQAIEQPAGTPGPTSPSPSGSTPGLSASPNPSPTVTRSATPNPSPMVAVPAVVNLSLADAAGELDRVGLKHQVTERPDGNVHPGTVVAVAPAPGTLVPAGSTVTLYVAVAPSPTGSATTVRPTVTASR